jgi:hypothetical protein
MDALVSDNPSDVARKSATQMGEGASGVFLILRRVWQGLEEKGYWYLQDG